ncbi:uncharacterized protein CCOS01_12811 [Colletotrichum costaricense]|uniref:Cyanovirin-N domain-containing protein n=2 Tax=Colletotrichum acutatum species complex TaxID=2707335 RepID=A0AAI9YM09_9PEZI|nr:uncharacterized protein CCOS01_12811 [Colletotrichum costaricense]XP_060373845.1 uncharacterized protein CTAM01_15578 [Colletotrichum tamarilloi]KAK1475912.1 hypothetical protein CTAM01_15578 [Colletotrichum tamarilloi]KAK1515613.1 hypothetical protein CCOS01_12811 [Colletotrichum costaricense]
MKSSILAVLLSIHLFATHLTALATRAATLDRKCPLESDCMENICTNFSFLEKEEKDPLYLVAQCKNKKGNYVYTKLDLKKCIANWDGNLEWTPRGGFRCNECGVFQKSADSYVGLRCEECKPRIFWLEGYKSPSINLSQGIWVSRDGALSCYDMNGEWYV